MTSKERNKKSVRSFVRREGRFTTRQKNAIASSSPLLIDTSKGFIDFHKPKVILEIGFDMGSSFLKMAENQPDTLFVGIEVYMPGIGSVLADVTERQMNNVLVIAGDAKEAIPGCIPNASLDGINIFFSDPWPKKRHHKRRLIQPEFISLLETKLKDKGILHLATDWENYAEHILEVLNNAKNLTNLSSSGTYADSRYDRPMTKYEKRGITLGHEVWDLVFIKEAK